MKREKWNNLSENKDFKVTGILWGSDRGRCPIYLGEEDVVWCKKLSMNENVAYRQVLNYTGAMKILKNAY